MSSLVIDSYIDFPILDVLEDGQPIFHRIILTPPPTTPAKDTQSHLTTATTPDESTSEPGQTTNADHPLIVTNTTQIHVSEHTSVYTASLDLDGDGELIDVVLKISRDRPRNDAFLNEYQRYSELEKYQGTIIPQCYGLFQATVAEEDGDDAEAQDVVSCLVLGNAGSPSAVELNKNSKEFNLSVIKALETLHDAGYTHGSVQASNILDKEGVAVLIDLEFAKSEHKCGRTASVSAGNLEYKSGEFGCSEIYNAARKMDLWKKSGSSRYYIILAGADCPAFC